MYIENNNDNSTQLVESIIVEPATVSLPELYKHQLTATVYPESVVNKEVRWHSENEDVATVNPSTGVVFLKKAGETTTIYATACDGSEVYGTCQVTVLPPIPVQGVHILDGDFTMYQGETKCPYPLIYPGSASNRAVMWCSSDPSVASVGLYTGEVWAVGPGTATITVTTLDGGFTSSITVTVYVDTVVIKQTKIYEKHDPTKVKDCFIEVQFQKSGKKWRCLENDLIFAENKPELLIKRASYNFYDDYETACDTYSTPTEIREYSNQEIKLLFAIDPHGVAEYVKRYAEKKKDSLEEAVHYKDDMFRLLFNRYPKYYKTMENGLWQITNGDENIQNILSESETIFGMHFVWHESLIAQMKQLFWDAVIDLALLGLTEITQIPWISIRLNAIRASDDAKSFMKIILFLVGVVRNGVGATIMDNALEEMFDEFNFSWADKMIVEFGTFIYELINLEPNQFAYRQVFDYCLNDAGFDVIVNTIDNGNHRLQELIEGLN